jgi:cell division protein FtsN
VAKKEQPKPAVEQPKPAEPEPKKEEPKKQEPKPTPKPVATQTTPGEVNALDQRTGKAYIIVASFVDGDLAADHASNLAGKGKSPYIIPPFNNGLYYRVAIAEFNTFDDATRNLENYKGEFGNDIWTLRY